MVSVIITTCKREPNILRRAINSVLNQTYQDWELIVVDDSPATYELRNEIKEMMEQIYSLNKGRNKICYLAHEENKGACIARNTALAAASGEYVAYLDDDDEWLSEKLALQVKKAEEAGPQVALIYCKAYIKKEGTERVIVRKRNYYKGNIYDKLILENFIGSTSLPLLRTNCLREIGGFDPLMQSAQDADVWLRLSERYAADYVDEPLVYYYAHKGEQISSTISKRIAGLERLDQKNQEYLQNNPHAFWVRKMKLAQMYARGGNLKKALKLWWKAAWKCPFHFIQNTKNLAQILRE